VITTATEAVIVPQFVSIVSWPLLYTGLLNQLWINFHETLGRETNNYIFGIIWIKKSLYFV